jgi:hypothetical protein
VALADTLLGSTENFAFIAPMSPEECAERLAGSVRKDMRVWDRRPLNGSVSSSGFFVRFWRNNRLPGDVRARGRFDLEPGGTRVSVTLDTNRAELLLLPLILVAAVVVAAFIVQQLWVAGLVALGLVAVYLRSRTVERSDRAKLISLIRDALITPAGARTN